MAGIIRPIPTSPTTLADQNKGWWTQLRHISTSPKHVKRTCVYVYLIKNFLWLNFLCTTVLYICSDIWSSISPASSSAYHPCCRP